MEKEPAAIVGTITAIVSALLVFAKAMGLSITEEQQDAIRGLVAVVAPIVAGLIIRGLVVPTERANDRIRQAALMPPGSTDAPVL